MAMRASWAAGIGLALGLGLGATSDLATGATVALNFAQSQYRAPATNGVRNSAAAGYTAGVFGSGGLMPTNWSISTNYTGLTSTVVGGGTESGFDYIELSIVGTPAAGTFYNIPFDNGTTIKAATGQTWTSAFRYRLTAGTTAGLAAILAQINEQTSGAGFVAGGSVALANLPDATLRQGSLTRVLAGGGTTDNVSPICTLTFTNGVAVNMTLRLYAPQITIGQNIGPYIRTTGAAATLAPTSGFSTSLNDIAGLVVSRTHTNFTNAFVQTKAGLLVACAANTPRISDLGLLAEPSAVNLCTRSQNFTAGSWGRATVSASITDNATTAPDGTLTAARYVQGIAGATYSEMEQGFVFTNTPYTLTSYFKANGFGWAFLQSYDGTLDHSAYFDLINGVVGTRTNTTASTITALANGWYRCSMTWTPTAGSGYVAVGSTNLNAKRNPVGDGTSGAFFWGAQVENTSYFTSYIATTNVSATRGADVLNINGLATQAIGSLLVRWTGTAIAGFLPPADLSDGTLNNFINVAASSAVYDGIIEAGGVQQYRVSAGGAAPAGGRLAAAISWAAAGVAYANNTGLTQTNGAITVPVFNALTMGGRGTTTAQLGSYVQGIYLYPASSNAAQLARLVA